MTTQTKKIVFAPGVLESMEEQLSTEDLQEILDGIKLAVEDGSLFDESNIVDMKALKQDDPELYALLESRFDQVSELIDKTKAEPEVTITSTYTKPTLH